MIIGVVAFLGLLIGSLGWVGWIWFLRPVSTQPASTTSQQRLVGFQVRPLEQASPPSQIQWLHGMGAAHRFPWFARARQLAVVLSPVVVIVMTAFVVLSMRNEVQLDPVKEQVHRYQTAVGAVLVEQRLVPPRALPPTVFQNVDKQTSSLESADRDWSKLDSIFAQLVLRVMERLQAQGLEMVLLEGYRSPERQEALAVQDIKVTGARGGQSKHQFGLAVDLAPFRDGHLVIAESDPWAADVYQRFGEEAEAVGLVWGGRWSFRDLGHIEAPGSIADNVRATAPAHRP